MRELSTRIDVTRKQVAGHREQADEQRRRRERPDPGTTVAQAMSQFDELDIEREVAEKIYSTAASAVEAARMNAENRRCTSRPSFIRRRRRSHSTLVAGCSPCWWLGEP